MKVRPRIATQFATLLAALLLVPGMVGTACAASPESGTAPVLELKGLGKGLAPLDGPWQFHVGDDLLWTAPWVNDTAGQDGWEQISADKTWGVQGHPSMTGYAWYRKHIHIETAPGAPADIAMLIRHADDAYEIYWNGELVGKNGKLPPKPLYYFDTSQPAQTFGLGPIRDGVLAIRMWKAPLNSFNPDTMGGFYFAPLLGSPGAIASRKAELDYNWMRSRQYFFGLNALYALLMVLSLLTWARNRQMRVAFWLGIFCLGPVWATLLVGLRLPFSSDFALGWLQPSFAVTDVGLWYLLLYLLKLDNRPRLVYLVRLMAIIQLLSTCLDGAITMLDWSNPWVTPWVQGTDAALTAIFTVQEAFPLLLVALAIRKKLTLSRWLVAATAFLSEMVQVVRIASQQGERYTHWTLGDKIGQPLFFINGNAFTLQQIGDSLLLLAVMYAVYEFLQDTGKQQAALQQEFQNARELQQVLIPEEQPETPGYLMSSAYQPASEVGGDFYQVVELEGGATLVVLGDVSGKGLRAAMAVSLIVGTVRTLAETTTSPGQILAGLNRRLVGRLQGGFTTAIAVRVDADGKCTMASAGHPGPYRNGVEVPVVGDLPLGLAPNLHFAEKTLQLAPGDHLALYTDGLLEARNPTGELFGFNRLTTLFAGQASAEEAVQAAIQFGQDDDVTVLTLTRLAQTRPMAELAAV